MNSQNNPAATKPNAGRDEATSDKDKRERHETPSDDTRSPEARVDAPEMLKNWGTKVLQFFRDRPVAAAGIAFMVGRMFARRQRRPR